MEASLRGQVDRSIQSGMAKRSESRLTPFLTGTPWKCLTMAGTFYCVMEYLPGLSLQKLAEPHVPLSPPWVIVFEPAMAECG